MPLTDFQRCVARLLAANRNLESHMAGGAVLNREGGALRISNDLDIFNDDLAVIQNSADLALAYAEADERLLKESGYSIEWQFRSVGMYRAIVTQGEGTLRLDWTTEPRFRFFPVQQDEDFGYCLHPADIAVNKVLALAGRTEIRDFLDTIQLDHAYLSLGALTWAACGKDPGLTPSLIMDQTNRHSRHQETALKGENLVRQVDLKVLKQKWIEARDKAVDLCARLPKNELGCLYLDQNNKPVTPDPGSPDFPNLTRHFGSTGGSSPDTA
jgi:hypothetical protein